jgi:hypothetical protein
MTPNGLRAQYLIPNLSLSAITYHPFVPSARATSSRNPTKSAQTDSLPNGSQLPTASSFAESFCRNLPSSRRILSPSWAHNSDSYLCQILVLTLAGVGSTARWCGCHPGATGTSLSASP